MGDSRGNYDRYFHRNFDITTAIPTVITTGLISHAAAHVWGPVSGPGGSFSMNRPVYSADMGDDPRSASGAEVADAAPGAACDPQSAIACDRIGAESTGSRAEDWAGHPNLKHKRHDAHIAHNIEAKVY